MLVDVSGIAREAGFVWPVAITAALWGLIEGVPSHLSWQDVEGRLWDVVWMASVAARKPQSSGVDQVRFRLLINQIDHWLKMVIGPGDDGEPAITIMLPDED